MNPDYIFVFLVLLIILLFFIAIKYFKYLLFYLGVFSGFLLSIYGKIFIDNKNYNLGFLEKFLNKINIFFSNSKIVGFLIDNLGILFFFFLVLLFHRFFYYLLLILLHFLKWLTTGLLTWIGNKKTKKHNININENSSEQKNNTD